MPEKASEPPHCCATLVRVRVGASARVSVRVRVSLHRGLLLEGKG